MIEDKEQLTLLNHCWDVYHTSSSFQGQNSFLNNHRNSQLIAEMCELFRLHESQLGLKSNLSVVNF